MKYNLQERKKGIRSLSTSSCSFCSSRVVFYQRYGDIAKGGFLSPFAVSSC